MKRNACLLGAVILFLNTLNTGCREANDVAHDEFGARTSLEKYEWFIDQSERIEKMNTDIEIRMRAVYKVRKQYSSYENYALKWPPVVRFQYNQELRNSHLYIAATIAQRKAMAEKYNSNSREFDWTMYKSRQDKPPETYEEYWTE